MASGQERRRFARSQQTRGNVSHDAQQRVDERVIEIMSRLDTAVRRDPPSDQASRAFRGAPEQAAASRRGAASSWTHGPSSAKTTLPSAVRSAPHRVASAATRPRPRPDVAVEGASRIAGMSWLWSRTRMGTVEVAAANRKRASAHPIPVTARRPVLVPSGSVRHGDWAVAGECFGGGAGVCGAARPRRRAFSSWKWRSIGLVASPESGSAATSEEPPSN